MTPYNAAYRRLRAQVLAEEPYCDDPLGLHPGERVRSTEADHVVPVTEGGVTTRENLRGRCRACNRAKSKQDRSQSWRRT